MPDSRRSDESVRGNSRAVDGVAHHEPADQGVADPAIQRQAEAARHPERMISKPGFSQPGESPRWRSNPMGSTAIQPEVFTPRDETACPILQIHQKAEPSAVCYWVGCLVGAHGNRVLRSVSVVSRISEIQDEVAVLEGGDDCRLRSSSAAAAARTAMVAVVGCSEPDRGLAGLLRGSSLVGHGHEDGLDGLGAWA